MGTETAPATDRCMVGVLVIWGKRGLGGSRKEVQGTEHDLKRALEVSAQVTLGSSCAIFPIAYIAFL